MSEEFATRALLNSVRLALILRVHCLLSMMSMTWHRSNYQLEKLNGNTAAAVEAV